MACCGGDVQLPPGFRFHPTDDELVNYYLCRKCGGLPLAASVIAEIDLYKFNPWDLPEKAAMAGDAKEWYFFSPRDRKYPNGSRPNRAAGTGYWKATGADKPVGSPRAVAIKKALVFYAGKPPRGVKTNWIMHEYRLADVDRSAAARKKSSNALRLDDWVLCRIYNKKGVIERYDTVEDDDAMDDVKPGAAVITPASAAAKSQRSGAAGGRGGAAAMKVEMADYGGYYDDYEQEPPSAGMLCFDRPMVLTSSPPTDRDSGGSMPPLMLQHRDGSSCGSEHVLSPSPDLPDRDHAESQPGWFVADCDGGWCAGGSGADDDGFVVLDDGAALFGPPSPGFASFGDMFASYMQREPF